jgi:serine/threonine-protein phosphatase 2A activator
MYLSAVSFINSVKSGAPFAEHSPVLNDISSLPSWRKVNEGLAKMYRAEVLSKLPVVQHFVFGSIFSASWKASREPVPSETMSQFLALHARGPRDAAIAARLVEASTSVVPTDEGTMAVAPWITEPIPAKDLATGAVALPLSRRSSGSGSGAELAVDGGGGAGGAPSSVSTAESFIDAFGPIPHVSPAERRRLSLGGAAAETLPGVP